MDRDKRVNKHLEDTGWKVMRFWEHEVKHNILDVVERIIQELKARGRRVNST